MNMDIRVLSVIISASVAIIIAVSNHFIIEPFKERRRWKKQQLLNLYYPIYGLMSARINSVHDHCIARGKIALGFTDNSRILEKELLQEIILKNAGYATQSLLEAWTKYVGSFPKPSDEDTANFVSIIVKDFNRLKKELGQKYNKIELETGIPEVIKELRKK